MRPLMMGLSCGKEYNCFMREIVEVEKLARSRTVQSVLWGTELKALLKSMNSE